MYPVDYLPWSLSTSSHPSPWILQTKIMLRCHQSFKNKIPRLDRQGSSTAIWTRHGATVHWKAKLDDLNVTTQLRVRAPPLDITHFLFNGVRKAFSREGTRQQQNGSPRGSECLLLPVLLDGHASTDSAAGREMEKPLLPKSKADPERTTDDKRRSGRARPPVRIRREVVCMKKKSQRSRDPTHFRDFQHHHFFTNLFVSATCHSTRWTPLSIFFFYFGRTQKLPNKKRKMRSFLRRLSLRPAHTHTHE